MQADQAQPTAVVQDRTPTRVRLEIALPDVATGRVGLLLEAVMTDGFLSFEGLRVALLSLQRLEQLIN